MSMESFNNIEQTDRKFQLYKHPWLSLLAVVMTSILSMIISSRLIFDLIGLSDTSPLGKFSQSMLFHILTSFIIAPFILRLPKGKTGFNQYLRDIGLSKNQPFLRLIVLALTCYVFLFMSQAASSFVYRVFEGLPVDYTFVKRVFDLSGDLPPASASLFTTVPSMFEEVGFRGLVLTVFLAKYSEKKSIIYSSFGFGLMHIMNLLNGRELVWVVGQVIWASVIGIFYGYVFVKTKSLVPSMMVHYLSNAFVASLTGYMQTGASSFTWAIYGVILSFGIVPTILMISWAKFFLSKWGLNNIDPLLEEK